MKRSNSSDDAIPARRDWGGVIIFSMVLKAQPIPQIHEEVPDQESLAPLYRVIIHNDEVTPMDFVVHILITVFRVPTDNAAQIMYTAHINGSAYVQTLPQSEARARINKAHFAARLKGYPLEFSMEPE